MINPYDTVSALEEKVAEYGGSKYAVAVDSCTNALLLCLMLDREQNGAHEVILPTRTYVGVAHAVINAGHWCNFIDIDWQGAYILGNTNIIDSARRFTRGMYVKDSLYCLSAHWGKHLKIGRGGFILTDDLNTANRLRRMRFDGRQAGVRPTNDTFNVPGYHCYMLPEEAARGLMLMSYMPGKNENIPWDDYARLDEWPIFKERRNI